MLCDVAKQATHMAVVLCFKKFKYTHLQILYPAGPDASFYSDALIFKTHKRSRNA